jgi:carbon monoxide dehydrogenase subunit G
MAHYNASVTSPRPPDEVFAYLADFRTVAEWDPSITESTHINDGEPIQVGAIFRVVTKNGPSETVLEYTTVELEKPHRIKLRGENDSMISDDVITVEPDGSGSKVNYDATIELKGIRKVGDPLMQLGLKRLGDKARDGLTEKLAVTG